MVKTQLSFFLVGINIIIITIIIIPTGKKLSYDFHHYFKNCALRLVSTVILGRMTLIKINITYNAVQQERS